MATPLGHTLVGYAIYAASPQAVRREYGQPWAALCVVMAVAPDLDVIPGFLQGAPVLYHGGFTHSVMMGLLASLAAAAFCAYWGKSARIGFLLAFTAYGSHLLLDFLGPDGRAPYGIPLLWPFTPNTYLSPVPLLLGMRHVKETTASTADFIRGIINWYNVAAVMIEIALATAIVLFGRVILGRNLNQAEEPVSAETRA